MAVFGGPCLAVMWLLLFALTVSELTGSDVPLMRSGLDLAGAGEFAPAVASLYLIMLAAAAFAGVILWACATVAGGRAAHRGRYPLAFGFAVPGDLIAVVVAVTTRAFPRGLAVAILVLGAAVTVVLCVGMFAAKPTETGPSLDA